MESLSNPRPAAPAAQVHRATVPGAAARLFAAAGFAAASLAMTLLPLPVAAQADDVLPPEEVFRYAVTADDGQLTVRWDIAPGYYMYRGRMRYTTPTEGIALGEASFSQGRKKTDEFFGEVEIYRERAEVRVPYERSGTVRELRLQIRSQGCADVGLCYPPTTWTTTVTLPPAPAPARAAVPAAATPRDPLGEALGGGAPRAGGGFALTGDDFLPVDQAFVFHTEIVDAFTVRAVWRIAEGYYLYRDKFSFTTASDTVRLQPARFPPGEAKFDEHFGEVQVFHDRAEALVPVSRTGRAAAEFTLRAAFQGCAEDGICYPPAEAESLVLLPAAGDGEDGTSLAATASVDGDAGALPGSAQNELAQTIRDGHLLYVVGAFFLGGVLLAFTPCVFPMFPILSGIIVGQQGRDAGASASTRRAFTLSLTYVLAMASTYTVAGVMTALLGANLQAAFQQPLVLIAFSILFVALALSMFGLYELQMPSAIQSRLNAISNRQQGGSLAGVAVMGALSALVVGPCVAAPLAAALIVIGQGGDPVRGGVALFALGMGMGAPLVAYGTSAGRLLPRAGAWMERVKTFFGLSLLAVAVWMLSRILPDAVTMTLWALLALGGGLALGGFAPFRRGGGGASGTPPFGMRVAGGALAAYGVVLAATLLTVGGTDPLRPFQRHDTTHDLDFTRIASVSELESAVARASAAGRPVMVDFYADWCTSCKEMEKHTFTDAGVQAALADAVLLQADVTANNEQDQALLKYFGIYGPPTIAFFTAEGQELRRARVVGYVPASRFEAHVRAVLAADVGPEAPGQEGAAARVSAAAPGP